MTENVQVMLRYAAYRRRFSARQRYETACEMRKIRQAHALAGLRQTNRHIMREIGTKAR